MHRKLIALAALAVAVAAISGIGYAAIPGSNGVISACRDSKGALKVIDAEAGQACGPNQQPLSWNQQGPAGAAGPQGPPGPAGQDARIDYTNVAAAGSLLGSSFAGISVTHTQTGVYDFLAPVSLGVCRSWVTFAQALRIYRVGNVGGSMLRVTTYDISGALDDAPFTLYLSC